MCEEMGGWSGEAEWRRAVAAEIQTVKAKKVSTFYFL